MIKWTKFLVKLIGNKEQPTKGLHNCRARCPHYFRFLYLHLSRGTSPNWCWPLSKHSRCRQSSRQESSVQLTIVDEMRLLLNSATLALVIFFISCDSEPVSKRLSTDIYEATIPTQGRVNQDIPIQIKMKASNGCYSDLKAELVEIDNRHFLIRSDGLFQTTGLCPTVIVYKDTTITFKPSVTGRYFFQINEENYNIRRDTIDID